MENCINKGMKTYPKGSDGSAQKLNINKECVKGDDFNVSHYIDFPPH